MFAEQQQHAVPTPLLRRLPAVVLGLPIAMLGLLGLVACGDTTEPDPHIYYPDKPSWMDLNGQYNEENNGINGGDGNGVAVVGFGNQTLTRDRAATIAFDDGVDRLLHLYLFDRLEGEEEGAGTYFGYNPGTARETVRQSLQAPPAGLAYRFLPLVDDPLNATPEEIDAAEKRYELYQRFTVSPNAEQRMVRDLIAHYLRMKSDPFEVDFTVALADMPQEWSYEERINRVVMALQQQVEDIGASGTVIPMEEADNINPADLPFRKQRAIANLPDGINVEVQLDFAYDSRSKIESIEFQDTRGRWGDPITVAEHPTPLSGKYSYSMTSLDPMIILKGQETIRVRITEQGGGAPEIIDYELFPNDSNRRRFEYTPRNIGLLVVQDFDGNFGSFVNMRNIVVRGDEGEDYRIQISANKPSMDGTTNPLGEGARATVTWKISIVRATTDEVFVLNQNSGAVGRSLFTGRDAVQRMDWRTVWKREDPDQRYPYSTREIPVEVGESNQLYVMVTYYGGTEIDVLRFDFGGAEDGEGPVSDSAAEVVFSTRNSN